MSQTSVTSYFTTRKRAAQDDISQIRNKITVLDQEFDGSNLNHKILSEPTTKFSHTKSVKLLKFDESVPIIATTKKGNELGDHVAPAKRTRSIATTKTKPSARTKKTIAKSNDDKQEKIVKFIKLGMLSPRKNLSPMKNPSINTFTSLESISNSERGMKTPTKVKPVSELSINEIKTKVKKSNRLDEIRASIAKIEELDAKLKKSTTTIKIETPKKTLKEFKTIEVEILSPTKRLSSHLQLLEKTPTKNESDKLMSPRKLTPQKLFSPIKTASPTKLPAYQRYQNLTEIGKSTLQLPYKYRCLLEAFKSCESVCAMFFNRNETISFKKLKPAVQRMLRKNFTEEHLAQFQHIFPNAYKFEQVKMRNFGSLSKTDTYQLVIKPNINESSSTVTQKELQTIDEDNVIKSAQNLIMNPQVLTGRLHKFHNSLIERVKDEHEKFLQNLDPPMILSRDKIKRWHPDFDLENCPEIEKGKLPQPPNQEKFSSAKDILSTARNLFNCATPMEKVMQRFEAKKDELPATMIENATPQSRMNESLLKGVPTSLLAKIRAKQAAKALDSMTRRPSQDIEAVKYCRLPDLTKHIRNVFVTEKKSILPMVLVLEKLENSYRGVLTNQEFETHIKLIGSEFPEFLTFPIIRNTKYIKITREADINKIIERLEKIASDKSN